jgi:hypothetical protein
MQYEIFDEDLDAAARAAVALLRTVMLQGKAAYNNKGEETVEAAKFLLQTHLAHRAHGTDDPADRP